MLMQMRRFYDKEYFGNTEKKISVCRFETKEHKHNSVRAVIDRKGL